MTKKVKALTQIKKIQYDWVETNDPNKFEKVSKHDKYAIYFKDIDDNIYKKLKADNKTIYQEAKGHELLSAEKEKETNSYSKMKSIISSSALVVNLFQYWQDNKKDILSLLKALLPNYNYDTPSSTTITFEKELQIKGINGATPNLDVIIELEDEIIAIESKFAEPYRSHTYKNLSTKYLTNNKLWEGLTKTQELAKNLGNKYTHLDAAQLIKHILGLKTDDKISNKNKKITLLYLWYNVPNSEEAKKHEEEIKEFAEIVEKDCIDFHHITYQKVIDNLNKLCPEECHQDYINYLKQRYNQQ
jgi:hypothetical protein